MKIIVGVDGSVASGRAVEWCAANATALDAEVVAVHAVELPVFVPGVLGMGRLPVPVVPDADRDLLQEEIEQKWCAPLRAANIPFRIVIEDGASASTIMATSARENADLVVTGRRGRGGFAELLLGSTSSQLSHHLNRPLVLVP